MTVQGPVKKQQPDRMSHRGQFWGHASLDVAGPPCCVSTQSEWGMALYPSHPPFPRMHTPPTPNPPSTSGGFPPQKANMYAHPEVPNSFSLAAPPPPHPPHTHHPLGCIEHPQKFNVADATLNSWRVCLQHVVKCPTTFVHKHKQVIQPPRSHNGEFHLQMFFEKQ